MKTLLLILGPTGVGKTELALQVAEHYGCPILNCDSRQVFRGIPIGTAAPTAAEQARVKHYFVACRDLEEDYNAGQYERDALALLGQLFATQETVVMTGGSMLYADAVCHGLDDLPAVPAEIRRKVAYPQRCSTDGHRQSDRAELFTHEGKEESREEWLKWLQSEVQRLDPDYWETVDRQNPARLAHCVELCLTTGKPYSSLLTKKTSGRPFRIIKVALDRPRAELYARIDERVQKMIADGLVDEARAVYPKRHLNSLQTVGYRELFGYFDGEYDLDRAIELIQQNSRHYAKRQLTWFRRDKEIHWLDANESYEKNISIMDALLRADGVQEE